MKIILAPEAAERVEAQIAYLRDVGAEAAERDRVEIATVWHTSQDRHSAPKRQR